jgi:hypothetical protein
MAILPSFQTPPEHVACGPFVSGARNLRLETFSDSHLQMAQFYFLFDGGGACGGLFF